MNIESWKDFGERLKMNEIVREIPLVHDFFLFYDALQGTECQKCKRAYVRYIVDIYKSFNRLPLSYVRILKKQLSEDEELNFYYEGKKIFTI